MTEQSELAGRLKELLRLDLEPVGVRVFGREEALPDQVAGLEPEAGVKSYCQALVKAARGEALCAGKSKLGCVLGTSTLGLEDDPEPLLDDTVREKYGAGLFESEEASRKSIEAALKFAPGANQAVLVGPLATMPAEAQLIILEIDPEQTMWLLYAANYQKGGAQDLPQSGGVAGGCADVTTYPLFKGGFNITFLGLGCRIKSGIPHDHLLMGLPADQLEVLVGRLESMAKPMAMLAKAREAAGG